MILNITDFSDEPLQSQLVRQIRAKILSSEISAGDELPSIRNLARDQHISVITVQRAYEALEQENLIHSRRGKGFFVSEVKDNTKKNLAKQRLSEGIEPLLRNAIAEGMSKEEIAILLASLLEKIKH
jgi:GntR family transcriptional regulator